MRKLALCCAVLVPATLATAAHAQVGIGTPDCHTQGVLYRVANHCPPEAIARAAQRPEVVPEAYRYPSHRRHYSRRHDHHPVMTYGMAHSN